MSRDRITATNEIPPAGDRRPWRVVYGDGSGLDPVAGAINMAIDGALLASVGQGASPVLRLYRWSPACLSFGRNQPARGRYDRAAARDRGIDFVRRPTGGQAVLHDDELTYAVIAPVAAIGKPRAAYALINRALVDGLGRLGVRAELSEGDGLRRRSRDGGRVVGAGVVAEDERVPVGQRSPPRSSAAQRSPGRSASSRGSATQSVPGPDWDAACFRRPARGEVVVGGAKLVGSAQRTERRTILQHGSILVGGSQATAEELLVAGSTSAPGSGTTLEKELGERPSWAELVAAVRAGFTAVLGAELVGGGITEQEAVAARPLRDRFASEDWTWRR